MNDTDDLKDLLARGIDRERVRGGEEEGAPYSGREWGCAAASAIARAVLRADFRRRRVVLAKLLQGFCSDGFFQLEEDDADC